MLKPELEAVLKQALPTWGVEQFPDQPENYRLVHPVGMALLLYGGSRYGQVEGTDMAIQERHYLIGVRLMGRSQWGDRGVMTAVDALIAAVPGTKTKVTGPLHAVRDYFVSEAGGIWQHHIEFEATGKVIANIKDRPC